jgi:hypothetical protein
MMSDREWTRRTWGLALGLLLVAGGASGQSLAEAAKREKERRAKAGSSGPAFTDEDLKRRGEGEASASGDAGDSSGRPAGEGSTGDKTTGSKSFTPKARADAGDEAYWRRRAKAARDAVAAAEAPVAQAQATLDQTQAGIRQPQPGDALKQVPPSPVADGDRRAAEANLAAAKAELARARKALEDLEDEARRKGVLPGWLR